MNWRKLLLIFVLFLLILIGGVLLYAFWPTTPNLAHLAAPAGSHDVRILRDEWGVPHVFGRTDADAAFGLAYAHAEDDFLTIQQILAASRGQLGRYYGVDAAPNDYMVQLLRLWEVVDANYDTQLDGETRALLDGYAAGLNHYAALHAEAALPGLFPVRGQDIAAGFLHKTPLFFGLDGVLTELFAEERQRPLIPKQTTTSDGRPFFNAIADDSLPPTVKYGSNVIAVGPGRSANGETFLAVNSHQPWTGPVAWYEAHIHSEQGWDAVGGLFPGAPFILHGHNRDLGWGFTVSSPDLIDVFVLDINPDNPNQYRFDGQWLDLEVRQAPITVKLLGRLTWTVRREVLWSVYGPTVRQLHGVYAVRYAGIGELGLAQQWLRLNKARNFGEWQAAMRDGPLPTFNVGYADREGNIYYLYNARLPLRAEGYDWSQYVPGNTSETLWTEYLPFDQLPQVLNPPSGFVQNSNSSPFQTTLGDGNPDPAAYAASFGIETRMSNRAQRSLSLLGSDLSITEAEFTAYKFDTEYGAGSDVDKMVEWIVAANLPDDNAKAGQAILRGWDRRTTLDSRGATLLVLTLYYLNETEGVHLSVDKLIGNDMGQTAVLAAYQQTIDQLMTQFGTVAVPWGSVNRLQRGGLDLPVGGAPDTLYAVYGEREAENGRLRGIAGDSYVLLVTWDAAGNVHSRSLHQFGSATLDENSPHYADQSPLFVRQQLKPVWLDEAEIRAHLQREYRPGEEISLP
ncbi:MAG: acylase [Ardenticatenaceae bacterium]|nr:acylase [Ardenticatenaceae bacterium]